MFVRVGSDTVHALTDKFNEGNLLHECTVHLSRYIERICSQMVSFSVPIPCLLFLKDLGGLRCDPSMIQACRCFCFLLCMCSGCTVQYRNSMLVIVSIPRLVRALESSRVFPCASRQDRGVRRCARETRTRRAHRPTGGRRSFPTARSPSRLCSSRRWQRCRASRTAS